jgi:hypothetical protein
VPISPLAKPFEDGHLDTLDVEQLFPSGGANLGFGLAYHAPAE